jgi:hypothetical protein
VIISHGDENLDVNELGMIARSTGRRPGDIKTTKWAQKGDQFGFSSPVIDGTRVYQIENGSRLKAYDLETGTRSGRRRSAPCRRRRSSWRTASSTSAPRAASSSSSGRRRSREILSEVELPTSKDDNAGQSAGIAEPVFAARRSRAAASSSSRPAASTRSVRRPRSATGLAVDEPASTGEGAPRWCRSSPTELVLKPGQAVKLHAQAVRRKGRFLRDEPAATWALHGLKGTVRRRHVHARRGDRRAGRDDQGDGRRDLRRGARARRASAAVDRDVRRLADGAVPPGWVVVGTAQVRSARSTARRC